jgi:hypothetical protein
MFATGYANFPQRPRTKFLDRKVRLGASLSRRPGWKAAKQCHGVGETCGGSVPSPTGVLAGFGSITSVAGQRGL